MKEIKKEITYHGKTYPLVFNLNVMERIQEEYGSIAKWGEITDGATEPDAKAVKFGITAMINEGIEIHNEDHPEDPMQLITEKQAGRIVSEYGLMATTEQLNSVVIESTQSAEKNA